MLSLFDLDLAKNELRTLLATQDSNGFIGHMIFWRGGGRVTFWDRVQSGLRLSPHHSLLIQPPVLAQALEQVYQRSGDEAFLQEAYPKVAAYHRWLNDHRDPDGDGLIALISNFESGMDHLPAYDEILGIPDTSTLTRKQLERKYRRLDLVNLLEGWNYNHRRLFVIDRFNCEDLLVNCIYAEGLEALAGMADHLGYIEDSRFFQELQTKVTGAVLEKCYDSNTGSFFSIYGKREQMARVLTVASLFPIILPDLPEKFAAGLVAQLTDPDTFWLPYPVPSVAQSERSFETEPAQPEDPLLWRGPTWINTNWFLVRGLRRQSYRELADNMTMKAVELVLREGFREFYNPFTGVGQGATDFAWSTLVLDLVQEA